MDTPLSTRELGAGPRVVLVHGGVGPELTWEGQEPLAERWSLVIPKRRGFPGSAPADRQDFEADAADIINLLGDGAHLVGFSYGGVGAAIACTLDPGRVRSLTLVESHIYDAAPDHPAVRWIAEAGGAYLAGDADEETEREFLRNAGIDPEAGSGRQRELIAEAMEANRGGRTPSEAEIDLDVIARSGIPSMVVSGDHQEGIEVLCDALADRLGSRREILRGAGHAVPRAPGFNDVLEDFLRGSAGTGRSRTA
jgi:pimeloyl-ACP methyl ester carboxylesterase